MSRARKLVEGAFKKLDEASARADAAALAKLSPAERERYDHWQERTAALNSGAPAAELGDPKLVGKVLGGPAGEVVHGVVEAPEQRDEIEDPAAWEEQRRTERAARDEIRAQYLAPDRRPVRITRVAMRGGHAAARGRRATSRRAGSPAVPISSTAPTASRTSSARAALGGERGGIVEWDVVHAADEALPRAETPAALTLAAQDVLVVRRPGEPAPLDEDLALHLLAGAGIGPEQTLAIARDVSITKRDSGPENSDARIEARVGGVHAPRDPAGPRAGGAPWDLSEGPPEGVVVDVLQWDAIAVAVHPLRQHRAPLPSPFPYLPLTPQELLTAYLEVVGVSPGDAYSAQVTHHQPFDLMGRHEREVGRAPDRRRARPPVRRREAAQADGGRPPHRDRLPRRARVRRGPRALRRLRRGRAQGAPAARPEPPRRGAQPQSRLLRTIDRVADVAEFLSGEMGQEETFVPPRYCWPPR